MKGDSAVASALKACADTFYTVPGYPVTDIARITGAELTINEKVALEYAIGDSLSQRRSAVIIKNVGLNTCADTLVNVTTQGLRAGIVIVAGDDIAARGSQNTQDSRYYGELAQVPVLEPGPETCMEAVEAAFEASEEFSRVAILRITPPLLEQEAAMTGVKRRNGSGNLADPDLTMHGRSQAAERGTAALFAWSRKSPLNRITGGIVGAGAASGDSHAVTVYPPPASQKKLLNTREFGRRFLHDHRCISAPKPEGNPVTFADRGYCRTFCRDCPFKPLMEMLRERKMKAICDIGCSVLAQNPPYRVGIACYALGSSVAIAARSTKVALIGDYALLHSGINALIDVYEKRLPLLCIVLKNDRLGMTGGQEAHDPKRYLAWADPVVCWAGDEQLLNDQLVVTDAPRMLVVEGACPEGSSHETVEC
ncbi:MAG: Indolepyruvate oxidoreductase subunit IorA [Methanoregula sp. PtaU1.Bin051]|nr:MAG: Indolepyruvate oxidoreductase subunit IorA [Methanoregula sp. PtaU1.Bin051]